MVSGLWFMTSDLCLMVVGLSNECNWRFTVWHCGLDILVFMLVSNVFVGLEFNKWASMILEYICMIDFQGITY